MFRCQEDQCKYHPDKFATKSETERQEAEDKFKEITEAYNTLSDAEKRKKYAEEIRDINIRFVKVKLKNGTIETLLTNLPKEIAGIEVLKVIDYKDGIITDLKTGEKTKSELKDSNVIYFSTP